MKVLVPVDGSRAALSALLHVGSLVRAGVPVEALLLNVQPRFHRHVSRFSSRAARDALRAERSAAAMAPAIEALTRLRITFRAVSEIGPIAERVAAVAVREQVDEIVMGTGRHPQWLRWLSPSLANATALFLERNADERRRALEVHPRLEFRVRVIDVGLQV